jgi:hypothetical protein
VSSGLEYPYVFEIKGNAVKIATRLTVTALLWTTLAVPALAQRLRTASPATDNSSSASSSTTPYLSVGSNASSSGASYPPSTAATAPAAVAAPATSTPSTYAATSPVATPSSSVVAGAAPSPGIATTTAPTYTPGAAAAGIATPATGVATQPPSAQWDPFGVPSNTPAPLLSNDPCLPNSPDFSMGTMQRFMERIGVTHDYIVGNGNNELGVDDTELSATFAFPWFNQIKTPFLITPGFAFHLWSGPISVAPTGPDDPAAADMPGATYDGYIDFAWNPQITESIGAELEIRPGIYSDFTEVQNDAVRVTGKGVGVIKLSPSMTIKAGVWYLDRVRVKMLPAGGIVWTPNPDVYFNILFPNPKIARRIGGTGSVEWWLYGRGEYGGGTWSIKRESGLDPAVPTDGTYDVVDYNDIRIAIGLDFKTQRRWQGNIEVGLSCARELVYASGEPSTYCPRNTVFFGASLAR